MALSIVAAARTEQDEALPRRQVHCQTWCRCSACTLRRLALLGWPYDPLHWRVGTAAAGSSSGGWFADVPRVGGPWMLRICVAALRPELRHDEGAVGSVAHVLPRPAAGVEADVRMGTAQLAGLYRALKQAAASAIPAADRSNGVP